MFNDSNNSFVKYGSTIAATGIALAAGYYAFSSTLQAGGNPFDSDTRKPSEPYQSDKEKRDAVLKNGYSDKKFEALGTDFDVIIIGSGIGGLTTGAILARAGKKVLILEQHDQCGGCCHSFNEKGFEFDTGIHYIGEMRNNTAFRFLMDQLSNGQLGWADVCDDFDTVVLVDDDGDVKKSFNKIDQAIKTKTPMETTQVSFKSGKHQTIQSLLSAFPDEMEAILKYFDILAECRKSMLGYVSLKFMPSWLGYVMIKTGLVNFSSKYFEFASISVTDMIKKVTANPTLRAVLSYNFGDYGTIPKDAPFSMHATLQNHFMNGVSYPVGGSSEISFHIVPTIVKAGGAVFVRAEVGEILINPSGNKAIGVKMKKSGKEIFAPVIVSAAGLYNTINILLKKQQQQLPLSRTLEHVRHGLGGISVYIGLNGTAEELGLEGKHYWAMWTKRGQEDLDMITEKYLARPFEEITSGGPIPLLFISFPSAKDPLWSEKHPGKSTCTIVSVGNYEWFRQWEDKKVMHRGGDYEKLKKEIGDLMWRQTLSLFPHLQDKVEYFDVGSPVTNNYYLKASQGEMYGCDHNIDRFSPEATLALRADSLHSSISNLYLSGQDIFSCGFAGAAFGGLFCAASVLNRNVYEDLMKLKAKSPPTFSKEERKK